MAEASPQLAQAAGAARSNYDTHRREFLDDNAHAEQLLQSDGEQSRRLADLRDREEQWHALAYPALAADGPRERAPKAFTDQKQDDVAAVIHAEEARLDQRRARAAELTVESFWTIGAMLALSVLITVLFVRRFCSERDRADQPPARPRPTNCSPVATCWCRRAAPMRSPN